MNGLSLLLVLSLAAVGQGAGSTRAGGGLDLSAPKDCAETAGCCSRICAPGVAPKLPPQCVHPGVRTGEAGALNGKGLIRACTLPDRSGSVPWLMASN